LEMKRIARSSAGSERSRGHRIGFVPTMGSLHRGHAELIRTAAAHTDVVVVSVFVNPLQFGPGEDYDRYPRDEDGDLAKARDCGVALAFCPHAPEELYPSRDTWVNVEQLDRHLCGRSRPGHFRGVCTVVCKLLALVRPDVTLLGEKDFQQLAIVRRMHEDLFLPGARHRRYLVPELTLMQGRLSN